MRPRLRGLRRTREVEAVARARPGGIEMLPGVRTRALRWRPQDRHRRDLVQEGPQVPHGRGGPRQGLPDLGRGGVEQRGAAPVPQRGAHPRAEAFHRDGDGRRLQVDKDPGQAVVPQCRMGHGPLPRRQPDERRPRRRVPREVAGGQEGRQGGDVPDGRRPATRRRPTPPDSQRRRGPSRGRASSW